MDTIALSKEWLEYGNTTLNNAFILEYLPVANGEYVKVYLYALLHAQAKQSISLQSIAEALGMEEADVTKAFRFWERRKLVVRTQDKPLAYEFVPVVLAKMQGNVLAKYQELNDVLYSIFGEKRVLHGSENAQVQEWLEELQLPLDLIMIFLQYMIELKGIDFRFATANKEIIKMKTAGVKTVEDAENYFSIQSKYEKGAKAVLTRFRNYRQATEDEILLYKKWVDEFGLAQSDILSACTETTKGNASFAYLDGILKGIVERKDKNQTVQAFLDNGNQEYENMKKILIAFGLPAGKRDINQAKKAMLQPLLDAYNVNYLEFIANKVALRGGKINHFSEELEHLASMQITSIEAASRYYTANAQADKLLRSLYDTMAIQAVPNLADRNLLLMWQVDYGFTEDILQKAASLARGKTAPIKYMQSRIEDWHIKKLTTIAEIENDIAYFRNEYQKTNTETQSNTKRVSHQNYTQRSYDKDDFNYWVPPSEGVNE